MVDYATCYPKAMPLRDAKASTVARQLATLFTRVGFPKQVITGQGMAFMGKTLKALWRLVGFQPLRTSVYHPQTNRLVQRFNSTLKQMLRKFVKEGRRDWHR